MFNGAFTDLLLLALAAILVVAAVIDVRTFTISNRLNLAVALLAPLYWLSVALAPWPGRRDPARGRRDRVRAARRRLLRRHDGRRRRQARRGARACGSRPPATLKFLVLMSLAGGVLTLGIARLAPRSARGEGRPEIPYGVAIAFGGLAILTQRFLNQFA